MGCANRRYRPVSSVRSPTDSLKQKVPKCDRVQLTIQETLKRLRQPAAARQRLPSVLFAEAFSFFAETRFTWNQRIRKVPPVILALAKSCPAKRRLAGGQWRNESECGRNKDQFVRGLHMSRGGSVIGY